MGGGAHLPLPPTPSSNLPGFEGGEFTKCPLDLPRDDIDARNINFLLKFLRLYFNI